MKQKAINQEILLIAGSRFSRQIFCKKDIDTTERRHHSPMEELEKACWDGMLNEWLTGLAGYPSSGNSRFIWNITHGVHSLCISIGPCPMPEKNGMSIDPHFFLSPILHN